MQDRVCGVGSRTKLRRGALVACFGLAAACGDDSAVSADGGGGSSSFGQTDITADGDASADDTTGGSGTGGATGGDTDTGADTDTGDADTSTGDSDTGNVCVDEVCDGVDNDCDGQVDEDCDCLNGETEACFTGDPGTEDVGECYAGTTECVDGMWADCADEVVAVAEECNLLDDDCDGDADEDFGDEMCGEGICMVTVATCVDGEAFECVPGEPLPAELCNGFDDDCNGMVDDIMCECTDDDVQDCYTGPRGTDGVGECITGTQLCVDGAWAACEGDVTPELEICDDIDNDCDGVIDNGDPGGGGACSTGFEGVCDAGTEACEDGAIVCNQDVAVSAEVCDDLDNNCNGLTDEGNPGGAVACDTGLEGVCSAGSTSCTDGAVVCNQGTPPSAELCDGLDNNCAMGVDEGNPQGGLPCSTGLLGVCDNGETLCSGGALECDQIAFAEVEVCNGLDDNCDGAVDEGDPAGGAACNTGLLGICADGSTSCDAGGVTCDQVVFPAGEACDGLDNDCDGIPDDGNPGGGIACGTGLQGVCAAGTTVCTAGAIDCPPDVAASGEVCDGLDNDCNGSSDDGDPGGGVACATGQQGVCAAGTTVCTGGALDCPADTAASGEVCDGLDNDCDGATDEGNPGGGGACVTGDLGVCSPGTLSCIAGALQCDPDVAASGEVCDGLDNDCDGLVDEGDPGGGAACATGGQGVCAAGTTACNAGTLDCTPDAGAGPEVCDGLDNDCDGVVDDGDPGGGAACSTGQLGVCDSGQTQCSGGALFCNQTGFPGPDVCDGLDNNCNGTADEGNPGGGAACSTGAPGVCDAGTTDCAGGALVCNQNAVAAPESCDGLDNDCDSSVDEGNPGGGAACLTGLQGECSPGTTNCAGGALSCDQDVLPAPEVCDGLDNDCDGAVDDGNPGGGAACSTGLPGLCDPGSVACSGGVLSCGQDVFPVPESCDGLDNDCDGSVDENNPGGGGSCSTGLLGECAAGTTTCSGGGLSCVQDTPAVAEICGDGLDNDCDGVVDCPGTCEEVVGAPPTMMGSNVGEDDDLAESCGLAGAETVISYTALSAGVHTFDAIGSDYDTVMAAYTSCASADFICNDDFAGNPLCGGFACSQFDVDLALGETIFISIAGFNGGTGNWVVNVTEP